MNKKIIISLFLVLFVFSGVSYANVVKTPFAGLTQDQVIQKYLAGRQLDPIEGVWLDWYFKPWIIIKTSLIDTDNKYSNYDYLMLEYSSSSNIYIDGVKKTQYNSCFIVKGDNARFLSPTALLRADGVFTRIYPYSAVDNPARAL